MALAMRERIERTMGACSAGGKRIALRLIGGVERADDTESERGESPRAGAGAKGAARAVSHVGSSSKKDQMSAYPDGRC